MILNKIDPKLYDTLIDLRSDIINLDIITCPSGRCLNRFLINET